MAWTGTRILDRLLMLTTRRSSDERICAIAGRAGWQLRRAGPRWFAVWSADRDRLRRLRVLLLPETWLALSPAQETALALAQLAPDRAPAVSAQPLAAARRALRRDLSRGA